MRKCSVSWKKLVVQLMGLANSWLASKQAILETFFFALEVKLCNWTLVF